MQEIANNSLRTFLFYVAWLGQVAQERDAVYKPNFTCYRRWSCKLYLLQKVLPKGQNTTPLTKLRHRVAQLPHPTYDGGISRTTVRTSSRSFLQASLLSYTWPTLFYSWCFPLLSILNMNHWPSRVFLKSFCAKLEKHEKYHTKLLQLFCALSTVILFFIKILMLFIKLRKR